MEVTMLCSKRFSFTDYLAAKRKVTNIWFTGATILYIQVYTRDYRFVPTRSSVMKKNRQTNKINFESSEPLPIRVTSRCPYTYVLLVLFQIVFKIYKKKLFLEIHKILQ